MEDLKIILSLCGTIFGLLVTVLTFLVKTVKSAKAKKVAEQALKISNSVLPFIKEAEKFTAYSGAEKKAYVMTKANQFALNNRIRFNETKASETVEELVALTKQVNAREKSLLLPEVPMAVPSEAKQTRIDTPQRRWYEA